MEEEPNDNVTVPHQAAAGEDDNRETTGGSESKSYLQTYFGGLERDLQTHFVWQSEERFKDQQNIGIRSSFITRSLMSHTDCI